MLVEDDPDILDMLTLVFDVAGYIVTGCATGAAALRALATGAPPACVVLDLRLPTLDGATLGHLLQRDPRWAHLPIVLMSAYPHGPLLAQTLHVPYFAKPFDVDDLVAEVGRLCRH
jgi:CheY-like chemotaxis protein